MPLLDLVAGFHLSVHPLQNAEWAVGHQRLNDELPLPLLWFPISIPPLSTFS